MGKDKDDPELPTIVQINVYRVHNDDIQFLLFERDSDHEDGQFWQPLSEPLGKNESIAAAITRIAEEQAGIPNVEHMSHSVYSYDWYSHDEGGRDIVFATQVDPDTPILPDLSRYRSFAWLPFSEAVARSKWSGSKEAIRQLKAHLDRLREKQTDNNSAEDDDPNNDREVAVMLDNHDTPTSHKKERPGDRRHNPDEDGKHDTTARDTNLLDGLPKAYDPDTDNDETSIFPL